MVDVEWSWLALLSLTQTWTLRSQAQHWSRAQLLRALPYWLSGAAYALLMMNVTAIAMLVMLQ